MAGFKDVLIHDYDDLNLGTIWETIRSHLPGVMTHVAKMLDNMK